MDNEEPQTPTALVSDDESTAADTPVSPAVDDEDASPVAAAAELPKKAERDRLADLGRERARLRQENEELRNSLLQVQQSVLTIQQKQTEDEQTRIEAYLRTLPPDQQALKRIELVEKRLAAQMARPASPAADAEEQARRAFIAKRKREILDEVNETFGLDVDAALAGDEVELDDSGEQAFKRSAAAIARERIRGNDVAKQLAKAQKKQDMDPNTIAEQIKQQVLRDLGVGAPLSARPAGGSAKVDTEDFNKVFYGHDAKKGPRAMMKKLADLRETAQQGAPQ